MILTFKTNSGTIKVDANECETIEDLYGNLCLDEPEDVELVITGEIPRVLQKFIKHEAPNLRISELATLVLKRPAALTYLEKCKTSRMVEIHNKWVEENRLSETVYELNNDTLDQIFNSASQFFEYLKNPRHPDAFNANHPYMYLNDINWIYTFDNEDHTHAPFDMNEMLTFYFNKSEEF